MVDFRFVQRSAVSDLLSAAVEMRGSAECSLLIAEGSFPLAIDNRQFVREGTPQ
jgi:hypothetical protein